MFLIVKGLKKKKKRLGFDLVLRASFHLTITIQESSAKTGQLPVWDCPLVVSQFKCHSSSEAIYFSNTFNLKSVLSEGPTGMWHQADGSLRMAKRTAKDCAVCLVTHSLARYKIAFMSLSSIMIPLILPEVGGKRELHQYKGKIFFLVKSWCLLISLPSPPPLPGKKFFLN